MNLDKIHESAGLFAWRETNRHVLSWNATRDGGLAVAAPFLLRLRLRQHNFT
ncbi:hypothetical protein G3N97_33070 [Paraburkholderia sp. Ac-20347]|nr:hypothetical protein [Paraburkholderia sp. Ac-20347]